MTVSVWRVNCSKLRATSTDLHRGARDAHGRIQPSVVSMVAAQPLRAASVEGMYRPKLHSQHLGRSLGRLGRLLLTPLVWRNESSPHESKGWVALIDGLSMPHAFIWAKKLLTTFLPPPTSLNYGSADPACLAQALTLRGGILG